MNSFTLKTCAAGLLTAVIISACAVASPSTGPEVVAGIPAAPELRIDADRLWMDWAPDGHRLVYVAYPRKLMLLDLADPGRPRLISVRAGHSPRFSPDGGFVAFAGSRGGREDTIYLQRLDGRAPIDLWPGELTLRSSKVLHRWLDKNTIAYDELLGTGIHTAGMIDVGDRRVTTVPSLWATVFFWSPDGRRVAGHRTCCPSRFWVWDRVQRLTLVPESVAGKPDEWFEAWSGDGTQVLFSEWQGGAAYGPASRSRLVRLDLKTGKRTVVAENAVLAAASGNLLAFLEVGLGMTLVVADLSTGRRIWVDDLGRLPDRFDIRHWDYRPVFAGPYLFFRTGDGAWQVSPAAAKAVATVYPADDSHVVWSPDGRHGAVLDHSGRLRVVRNPLSYSAETPF